MGRVAGTRDVVEDHLSGLEQLYGAFPVNQTTVTLPHEQFERVDEDRDAQLVDAYVEVHDEDERVLHVETSGTMELPGRTVDLDRSIEQQLRETVREDTGVEFTVEGIESVTIAGVRDEDDPDAETLYHLVVVFEGQYESGDVDAGARWERERNEIAALLA